MDGLVNLLVAALAGRSVWSGLVVVGAALCVAAVAALLAGLARPASFASEGAGPTEFAMTRGALDGLPLGLACGLFGGFAFQYTQSLLGVNRFTFAAGLPAGLALGAVCGAFAGFALGRLTRLPGGLALGALGGLLIGLGAFFRVFGQGAGYGPETDSGVGPEVGVLLGTGCLLLGALVAVLLRAWMRQRAAGAPTAPSPRGATGRSSALGAAVGAGVGALCWLSVAVTSWAGSAPQLIVPEVAPAYATPGGALGDALYWLAVCVVAGALIGALAGAAARVGGWRRAVSLSVSLALGALFGLTLSLTHGDVGGPLIVARRIVYDPMGSLYGLAGGLLVGALGGVGCALALRWAERQPGRRSLIAAVALFALGGALLLAPVWFHPLFGVDVP